MRRFTEWLAAKWQRHDDRLAHDARATFSSEPGRRFMQYLIDRVYATVYEGTDAQQLWQHNARRALVHEMLELMDHADHPDKYTPHVEEGL